MWWWDIHLNGDLVVWAEGDGYGESLAMVYDVAAGTRTQLTDNTYRAYYPHTDGNQIVWQASDGGEDVIYLAQRDYLAELKVVLDGRVEDGVIDEVLQTSLLRKVESAESSATREHICAAVSQLGALVGEVNAQRGKKITDGAADEVVALTRRAIAYLENQLSAGEGC